MNTPRVLAMVLCATAMILARTVSGQTETILLPLAFGGATSDTIHGAYGTEWQGETWMANNSTAGFFLQNPGICPAVPCEPYYDRGFIGRIAEPLWIHPERGVLLHPPAEVAGSLTFSARIVEVTRHAQPEGFQLPVVRSRDFLTRPSIFLGIPTSGNIRTALRLYDPRRVMGSTFKIEVLDGNGSVLGQTTLATTFSDASAGELLTPGFAVISDVTSFFRLTQVTDRCHIRVTPTQAGAEYWAMVSVTDNDTQQVLIITPQ